jgi:hypothetical protein
MWLLRSFRAMGHCGNIFLCAMGHWGKFVYTLWATAADLVTRYEPLCRMRPYSKNLWWFLHYGWLCAMGHSAKPTTTVQKYTVVFKKLAITLKGTVMLKKCMHINSTIEGLYHPSFESLGSAKKISSPQWPIAQYEFWIRITRQIRNRIRKKNVVK